MNRNPTNAVGFNRWLPMFFLSLGGLILFCFNPAEHAFYPVCLLHRFTGLQCPGCGTLRALHQLSHGHLLEALRLNPLTVVALPWLGVWLATQLLRQPAVRTFPTTQWSPWLVWAILAVIIAFTVLRNLPFGNLGWLAQ